MLSVRFHVEEQSTTGSHAAPARTGAPVRTHVARLRRGAIELAFLAVLYVGYSASRLLASDDLAPARARALELVSFERTWHLDVEARINAIFVAHDWLGIVSSYWYATTHYLVTAVVLLWLYRRSASSYVVARRVLVIATLASLWFFLTLPTAPPRLVGGYADVLSLHAASGWWGADASAPQGLGHLTNELAAFPSMHAGWALWVALVLVREKVPRPVQALGLLYAAGMAVDVLGTGNHWVLDVVVGWAVVLVAFGVVVAWERRDPVVAHEELRRPEAPRP